MVNRHVLGAQSKRRGNGFENELAKQFSAWSGKEFVRTPGSGSLHWNSEMNVDGDVIAPPSENFPYLLEAKRYADWDIENLLKNNSYFPKWIAQAVREGQATKRVPFLIYRRNGIHAFVTMPYNQSVAKMFKTHIVTSNTYVSEIDASEETIKVLTVTIDELFTKDYEEAKHWFDKVDWQKQITKSPKKKVKKQDIKDVLDSLDKLDI